MTKITTNLKENNSNFLERYSKENFLTQTQVINQALEEFRSKHEKPTISVKLPFTKKVLDEALEHCIKFNTNMSTLFSNFCNDTSWQLSILEQEITVSKYALQELPKHIPPELFCLYLTKLL